MSSDMEQKQIYLRTQILEKGYDAQKFINFLNQKLNIGDDLSLCSLQQLIYVVNQFVYEQKNKKQSEQKAEIQKPTQTVIKQTLISQVKTISKPRSVNFEKYNFSQPQFSKNYQCIKIIDKVTQGLQLHCEVGNPQRKSKGGVFGFMATSFLQFQVKTIQKKWVVGRRYSDFVWLRNYLRKVYPTQIVPPIPQKKASKKTQRHVQKRMRILQYFLNDVVSIPQFANNKYVEGFLSITDDSKLQSLKQESQKIKQGTINTVQTESGVVNVNFTIQNKVYMDQMKRQIPQIQKIYKQITRQSKALQNFQIEEVNTLYQMGNLFAQLHERSRQILNKLPKSSGLAKLNKIYVTLNNMTIQWGNLIKSQFQIIQKNLNTFYKYIRNDLHGYFEIFQAQQQIEQQFAKFKINLQKKKQKIYNTFDINKWQVSKQIIVAVPKETIHDKAEAFKIMLPRQNIQLQKLRVKNALYISQMYENGDKNLIRSAQKFVQNFKQWSVKMKVSTQQISELWGQTATSFSGENKVLQLKQKPVDNKIGDQIIDD